MQDWQHGGFGLYLHWPFCQSKCPYCDFNSHVAARIDQPRWQRSYLAEIDRIGFETAGRVLNSVFFGGGTPSLMEPDLVAAILARVRETWRLANDFEITLEANPGSVEAGRFRGYRDAGVNRISMGIQALDDAALRRLGRIHSVVEARAAFDVARATFERVSFDLIYARQDQTLADWRAELQAALAMAADHLSLYQLTIEENTVFGDRLARGLLRGLPGDDLAADFFAVTQEMCDSAGLPAYEVSNHARPGSESRHNLIYWRAGDYAGVGPGAHGRLTLGGKRWATEAPKGPDTWLTQVEATRVGEALREVVAPADQALEYLMMALRLNEGVSRQRFASLAGRPINAARIARMVEIGMIEAAGDRIKATMGGRMVLNSLITELACD
ncbi:MAG: radical SAM family heme chaperone HemW [Pseudorhodobacter sp.]|nr:radical SAM family heme chaperone HemW [Pseudorhodobacter sp.]